MWAVNRKSGLRRVLEFQFGGVRLWIWAALLATALAARTLSALADPLIQRDTVTFLTLARQAREEDPLILLRHDQHPLYPALVALTYPILGNWELTGFAISILAGALTVIPVVLLGSRVAGPLAGMLGGWIYTVCRYPVQYSSHAISDALHGLFFAAAAWAGAVALGITPLAKPDEKSPPPFGPAWSFLLAGLFSGMAYLVRPEGLVIAMAIFVAAVFKFLSLGFPKHALRSLAGGGMLLGLALAATVGPYAGYLSRESGTLRLTRKKPVIKTVTIIQPEESAKLSMTLVEDEPGPAPKQTAVKEKDPKITPRPGREKATLQERLRSMIPPRVNAILRCLQKFAEGLGWIPAGLLVFGLLSRRRGGTLLAKIYLLTPVLVFVILVSGVYLLVGLSPRRNFYPLTPLMEGWVGLGMISVGYFVSQRFPGSRLFGRSGEKAAMFLTVLTILAMIPKSVGWVPASGAGKELWRREVGMLLREAVLPSDGVLVPQEATRIAFYSGGRVVRTYLPPGKENDFPWICNRASELGTRWILLVGSSDVPPPDPPPGWILHLRLQRNDQEVQLYRKAD